MSIGNKKSELVTNMVDASNIRRIKQPSLRNGRDITIKVNWQPSDKLNPTLTRLFTLLLAARKNEPVNTNEKGGANK